MNEFSGSWSITIVETFRPCLVCRPQVLTFPGHSTQSVAEFVRRYARGTGVQVVERKNSTGRVKILKERMEAEKRKQNDDPIDKLLRLFLQTSQWLG